VIRVEGSARMPLLCGKCSWTSDATDSVVPPLRSRQRWRSVFVQSRKPTAWTAATTQPWSHHCFSNSRQEGHLHKDRRLRR
jgi:hypothetical protein